MAAAVGSGKLQAERLRQEKRLHACELYVYSSVVWKYALALLMALVQIHSKSEFVIGS